MKTCLALSFFQQENFFGLMMFENFCSSLINAKNFGGKGSSDMMKQSVAENLWTS